MKVFIDSNVLVAACIEEHEHHERALPLIDLVHRQEAQGFVSAHSLLEIYAVLTRFPRSPRIMPVQATTLVEENILKHFTVVALTAREYGELVRTVAANGTLGGQAHDMLHLECARKSGAERIYTFNVRHFASLTPRLTAKVLAP
jgi:predicted nucleic acid-binding protein